MARRQRLAKIAEMWDEDLRTQVGSLVQARVRAEEARRSLAAFEERTAQAREERGALMGGASADEWRAREAWIATCAAREERAAQASVAAEEAVRAASAGVTAAQQKVERMKLVLARLDAQEALAERRAEQRSQDEIAARISQTHLSRNPEGASRSSARARSEADAASRASARAGATGGGERR